MKDIWPIDRDPEPALDDRSRTFFYADEIIAARERQVGETTTSFITFLLAGAALLGVGLVIMEMML